ncbi:MAG: hypothetical protein JJE05_08915 [Actinobacteria bacterium]|nr:hypothetical protein [Actinomycetota bacterium]
MVRSMLVVIYFVIGLLVANSHGYFDGLNDLESIVSAMLAVFLWPLVVLGVNVRIGRLTKN